MIWRDGTGKQRLLSNLDRERELKIGEYRVLLTHGHYYNVSLGVERLEQEARDRRLDIVMYGHTHRPFYEVRGGDHLKSRKSVLSRDRWKGSRRL